MGVNNKLTSMEEDDAVSYDAYLQYLNEDIERNKNKVALEFKELGDKYIKEIERKKQIHGSKKIKYIKYILSKSDKFDIDELNGYELQDVIEIYNELKIINESKIKKFIHFIFNL